MGLPESYTELSPTCQNCMHAYAGGKMTKWRCIKHDADVSAYASCNAFEYWHDAEVCMLHERERRRQDERAAQ